ncbi:hypothetical protein ACFIOY_36155 [Bradyrhizobium sp. TZ2]
MTGLRRLDSQYDAFLFASLCETDGMPLSVLTVLVRQDVDPWQEAEHLTQLSREQAINSLASKIWKSNSERWSPSEASILADRLIDLLPSHGNPLSNSPWTEDSRMTLWLVAWMIFMSIGVTGHRMQGSTQSADTPTEGVSVAAQETTASRSPRGIGTARGMTRFAAHDEVRDDAAIRESLGSEAFDPPRRRSGRGQSWICRSIGSRATAPPIPGTEAGARR